MAGGTGRTTRQSSTGSKKKTTRTSSKASTKAKPKAVGKGEWLTGLIDTPKGAYTPQSDDLAKELVLAARHAELAKFKVFVNGAQVMDVKELPCKKISELKNVASVAGVEASMAVQRYDKAG